MHVPRTSTGEPNLDSTITFLLNNSPYRTSGLLPSPLPVKLFTITLKSPGQRAFLRSRHVISCQERVIDTHTAHSAQSVTPPPSPPTSPPPSPPPSPTSPRSSGQRRHRRYHIIQPSRCCGRPAVGSGRLVPARRVINNSDNSAGRHAVRGRLK